MLIDGIRKLPTATVEIDKSLYKGHVVRSGHFKIHSRAIEA